MVGEVGQHHFKEEPPEHAERQPREKPFSLTQIGEREESKPRCSSQQGETKKLPLEDDLLWMHTRQ